jgi:two-component system, chemotaxis family, sensor kinase Cph1
MRTMSPTISTRNGRVLHHSVQAEREQRQLRHENLGHLIELLEQEEQLEALLAQKETLLGLNDATSGALVIREKVYPIGNAPSKKEIAELNEWLSGALTEGLMKTMQLPKLFPPAAPYAAKASGLLALEAGKEGAYQILWFKPEIHPGWPTMAGHVPRMSMTYRPKQLSHTSAPWTADELAVAWKLRQAIQEVIVGAR